MKSFGEFASGKSLHFEIEDIKVILDPVPIQLFERHIMGVDDTDHTDMVKYRVTFQYPKSKNKAAWGDYSQEVRYVLASSPQEAKERIVEYIQNKKKQKTTQKPFPYLAALLRKEMNVRVKKVVTWNDFVELLSHVAQRRYKNPLHYFDQHDLSILINKLKRSRDFNQDLQNLPKKEQLLLKRIYFHIVNGPLSPENKEFLDSPHPYWGEDLPRHKQLAKSAGALGKYYPKPVYKDLNEEPTVNGGSPIQDIIREAGAYGITYRELSSYKKQLDEGLYGDDFMDRVRTWKEIDKRLAKSNYQNQTSKNLFYKGSGRVKPQDFENGDQTQWDKFGADEWPSEIGRWTDSDTYDPNDNNYQQMYDFWMKGKPTKIPLSELWYRAFMEILEGKRREQKELPETPPENVLRQPEEEEEEKTPSRKRYSDEVPF